MIKKIKYICFAIMLFSSSSLLASDTKFINGFEDVPMMPKLHQADDSGIAFDTEFGRIVETYLEAEENVEFKNVVKYYSESLPELGWKKASQSKEKIIFGREGEVLEIILASKEKPITVKFSLHD